MGPAATTTAAVIASEAALRFSAPGFTLPGQPATASVGDIRQAVAAAIAAQSADAASFPRVHSGSSSVPSDGGSLSDGVQWVPGAAHGTPLLQQARVASAPLGAAGGAAGGSSPSRTSRLAETIIYEAAAPPADGPRVAAVGIAPAFRQSATAPVDICRTVRRATPLLPLHGAT